VRGLRLTEHARSIRILIADDHDVVRQGLRAFLELDPALKAASSEAVNGSEAVKVTVLTSAPRWTPLW
jgi:DNA-binding NarL/FixJ family response regulator